MLQFWLGQLGRYAPRNRGWAANPRTARNMADAPLSGTLLISVDWLMLQPAWALIPQPRPTETRRGSTIGIGPLRRCLSRINKVPVGGRLPRVGMRVWPVPA